MKTAGWEINILAGVMHANESATHQPVPELEKAGEKSELGELGNKVEVHAAYMSRSLFHQILGIGYEIA